MQQRPEEIIKNVLEIINYEGNKEKFSMEFLNACYRRALQEMGESLSKEEQENYVKLLNENSDPEKVKDIFAQLHSRPEFADILKNVTSSTFDEYMTTITPTLSPEQLETLDTYFASLRPGATE